MGTEADFAFPILCQYGRSGPRICTLGLEPRIGVSQPCPLDPILGFEDSTGDGIQVEITITDSAWTVTDILETTDLKVGMGWDHGRTLEFCRSLSEFKLHLRATGAAGAVWSIP